MTEFWKQSSEFEMELEKINEGKEMSLTEKLLSREIIKSAKIMEEMNKKIIELEQRISKTENIDRKKIRKNIMEYLKENKSSLNYSEWTISDIGKNEFEYLNDYSYKDAVLKILKKNLLSASELPICAFTEIKNDVFIYTKRSDIDGWVKIEQNDLKSLVSKIDNKFNKYYFEWQDENAEKQGDLDRHYMKKLDYSLISTESTYSLVKKCLYSALNKPMKQIVEYG
jgi:hypothetical protein